MNSSANPFGSCTSRVEEVIRCVSIVCLFQRLFHVTYVTWVLMGPDLNTTGTHLLVDTSKAINFALETPTSKC